MRVRTIVVKNFRLLRDLSVDLEGNLSLIIGKNNSGKTSLLLALEKFLGSSQVGFSFDDFNVQFKEELRATIENPEAKSTPSAPAGIYVRLFIEYDDNDDLSNVGNKVLMD